jgi:hypothetical protein
MVPLNDWQTIPFGAIIDNRVDKGDVEDFSYLGEFYQYSKEDLKASSRPITPVA